MTPHAVFEAAGLKSPLAAESTVIFRTFSLSGFRSTRETGNQHNRKKQN
jgi:hypothetical protein